MRYEIKRTDEEIEDLLNRCYPAIDSGRSRFPGMSYEDGIREAIDWLTEDEPESDPLE